MVTADNREKCFISGDRIKAKKWSVLLNSNKPK